MSNIKSLVDSFEIRRVREVDTRILQSMAAPVVDGKEQRQILDLFISDSNIEADKQGVIASFVVLSPTKIPLVFFSLRCGELFAETSADLMRVGHDAYVALYKLYNKEIQSQEDYSKALSTIRLAKSKGLTVEALKPLYDKQRSWEHDSILDANKEVNKVLDVFPAVELQLFGVNEAAKPYWHSLGFPNDMKMGESLFFLKVVSTIQMMMDYVGCQYLYLFAADKEAEGQLVQYYRVRLGFNSDIRLMTNKPRFDWECQFLFQDMDSLLRKKEIFFQSLVKNK